MSKRREGRRRGGARKGWKEEVEERERGRQSRVDNLPSSLRATSRQPEASSLLDDAEQKLPGLIYVRT